MRRISVVDDELHTRLAIGIWLKQCGFRVAITDGGESGLAALNEGTFDLMIVDVFMPNMRGFESIRDGKYGPNCQGIDHPAFAASSILAKRRKPPAPPPNQENQTASL
jgi:CheY-like chemotaxis protein